MPTRERRAKALGLPLEQLPDRRGRHGNHVRAEAHWRWNGQRLFTSHGYVLVRVPKGNRLDVGNGYAYEHVVILERKLGRELKAGEHAHHLNHVRDDNRPENIVLMTASEHSAYHSRQRWHGASKPGQPCGDPELDGCKDFPS